MFQMGTFQLRLLLLKTIDYVQMQQFQPMVRKVKSRIHTNPGEVFTILFPKPVLSIFLMISTISQLLANYLNNVSSLGVSAHFVTTVVFTHTQSHSQ